MLLTLLQLRPRLPSQRPPAGDCINVAFVWLELLGCIKLVAGAGAGGWFKLLQAADLRQSCCIATNRLGADRPACPEVALANMSIVLEQSALRAITPSVWLAPLCS